LASSISPHTEAGLIEPAIASWQLAGQYTIEHSARAEAVAHLRHGLELMRTLPDTLEHRQDELHVQTMLREH
jgi:hypothetical protein